MVQYMHYWEVSSNINKNGVVTPNERRIFMVNTNAIIIHGGGLVDPSKVVLMRLAQNLSKVYNKVFIAKYSFEGLYKPKEYWLEYNETLVRDIEPKRGTYFGTCRGIDLTDPEKAEKTINILKAYDVNTIIIAGGDGSARQAAEISPDFKANGINIIFPAPLTIDGINGGLSIGIKEAVKESIRQIDNIVSTSLKTRDNEQFGIVMVELQGRNRDDILANVLAYFCKQQRVNDCNFPDLLLRVVPANLETDESKLIEDINNSSKRTLILVSEGSNIKISDLKGKVNRKVRSLVVGYSSQSNDLTSPEDIAIYNNWIDKACEIIAGNPYGSYSIVNKDGKIFSQAISYYANLNPRKGQKATLPEELSNLVKEYMA